MQSMKDTNDTGEVTEAHSPSPAKMEAQRPRLSRRAIIGFVVTTILSASLLLLLFVRLINASQAVGNAGTSPVVGHAAPDFSVSLLNGKAGQTLRLADLKGKPVVVNFWASWCDPCVDEAPVLEAASQRYAAQGVVFVGVSYEDEPSDSMRFLQQYGVTYPVGTDGSAKTPGAIAIAYGVLSPPETYFINPNGVVVDEFSGPLSANLLDQRVARILP